MSSFSASLSGLDAEEQALSVISNDLSNLNTTAFKTGTPVFSDLFYQMLGTTGAGDPVQIGVGATMSSVSAPMTQGNIASTGVPTDVAIQGNGMFILSQNGTQVYSRAGNFSLDEQGNLVDSNGANVMGYSAVNGVISTSQALSPIVISSGQSYPPNASSNMQLDMNLDATDTSLGPATGTLNVPPPVLPNSGQTVSIGGTTYSFATTITPTSAANTVLIGGDIASTLANLAGAINAASTNGQAAGTTYSTGTAANAVVKASGTTDTSLSLQAIQTGVGGNALATSTAWAAGSFAGADLSGGVNAAAASGTLTVPPPLPTPGQAVTIGGTTYTFATGITPQSGADTVLIGADISSTLANLAGAINASTTNGQAAGSTYSLGTVANAAVTATGSSGATLNLQAIQGGLAGDSLVTSSNWAAGSFGAADLTGGVNALPANATFTVPPATLPIAGNTVAIGGTTYTFVGSTAALTSAGDVLIGANVPSTLANLAGAINASTANGQGVGATYGMGTVANGSVTATGTTGSSVTLQALQGGSAGDVVTAATNWTGASFGVANLTGGANGQAASATFTVPAATLPNAGDTVVAGGTTYTFAAAINAQSAADTVLIGPDVQSTLANLAGAINASSANGQAAGTTYGTGTVANTALTATGSTATTVTLQAAQTGTSGNSLGVSASWTGGLFAAGDLAGGADAVSATGHLTVALPLPTPGQTVSVGGTTYTFAASITPQTAADTVLIGADVASTLANLVGAINASSANGQASGTTYSLGTVANGLATATGSTGSALSLRAIQMGTTGNNSITTATNWAGGSFGGVALTGGVDAQAAAGSYTVPIPLPKAGQTVTVGGATYTFAATITPQSAADTVLIGPDVQSTLANLAGAINASSANGQGAGTTYGSGTVANSSVTATGSTASELTLQAIQSGTVGNTVATSTSWTGGAFQSGDLAGGTDAGKFSDSLMVYDSLGNSHVLSFSFTKSAAGTWAYQITIPAADVGAVGAPQVVKAGTLQFGPDGNLMAPSADVQDISISGLADGAKTMSLNWQLFNSSGTPFITQTAEASATSGKEQDGYSAGTLQSYSIDSTGTINGVLSNSQTVALDQIALATFPSYDGLTRIGSNDYQTSLASGVASVGVPGSGGRGTLKGSSLEQSNVDIATAFTMLIQAERGYQANAKAITTADNVMQSSINLIQG